MSTIAIDGMHAVLLGTKVNKATGWPTETYVIRDADETPVLQVTLCKARDGWFAWTGSYVSSRDAKVKLAERLAEIRRWM